MRSDHGYDDDTCMEPVDLNMGKRSKSNRHNIIKTSQLFFAWTIQWYTSGFK